LQTLIRASGYSNGQLNCYDLGPNSLIDVTSSGGTSLLCNGTAIPADYLFNTEWGDHFPSLFSQFQYQYVKAFCGNVNGFLVFNDAEKYLEITPDSSDPVSEVQTVTISGTVASGNYYFAYKGQYSDSLAYNANTTTMNAALNGLPFFATNSLSCVCSAAATSSFTITISGVNTDRLDGELIKPVSNNLQTSVPAQVTNSTARTTISRRGFTTGTFTATNYLWEYRSIMQNGNQLDIVSDN
jgi:hypothetical protein